MPRCPFCNYENPVGIRLCPNCGAALPESIGSAQTFEDWKQEIRALLGEGQKIEAIKLYRERTGVWLRQAKEAVEAIERGEPLPIPEMVDERFERDLIALLDQGQKIEAIKLYRECTGVGLKEAKDAVEAIQRGERPQDAEESDNSFHQTLVSLLKQGRKIDAIKVFREVTGSGLKESKDAIESIAARHGLSGSQRTGCLGLIVLCLAILACGFTLVSGCHMWSPTHELLTSLIVAVRSSISVTFTGSVGTISGSPTWHQADLASRLRTSASEPSRARHSFSETTEPLDVHSEQSRNPGSNGRELGVDLVPRRRVGMIAARPIVLENVDLAVEHTHQLPLAGDFQAMQRVVQQALCLKGREIELGALATQCPRSFMFGVGVVLPHAMTPSNGVSQSFTAFPRLLGPLKIDRR
jgi:ribosomal protein L7/L12